MMQRRNCKHQGFAERKNKKILIICDWDGNSHDKKDCLKCENYVPKEKYCESEEGEYVNE